jgi:GTP-binding protein EngB required for normal cell division
MDLREYEQNKFAIAEILRSASVCVPEPRTELRERLEDLFARLAEDRFNLVVVGRFNRGKTSLMNAILGSDRLATGIVPLTSVITTVGYGSKERVILKCENRILDNEIPIQALPQHITQQGNPGNVQRIKMAEVQLPAENLRRGFYFVDTPGLGSVIVENTLTTEAFLPEADALLLVTSYESPLSEEEVRFFKAGSSSGRRIFVVLNKHDTISPEERQVVIGFVREHLNVFFGRSTPLILSVSSTDGLQAKLSGEEVRLGSSGIPELEKQLISFLLTEKSNEFLLRMCDRVREFLQELPRSEESANLMLQIGALGKQFGGKERDESTEPPSAPVSAFPDLHQLQTCEICAKVADKLWDFLCQYQYEIIVNRTEQQRFADRGGLCPFHAWQLQSIASPYGMCAGYPPLLDRLAAKLRDFASNALVQEIGARVRSLVPSEEECTLCNAHHDVERDAIAAIAKRLEGQKGRALNELSAICLPHFAMLLSVMRGSGLVRTLLERQAAVLQRFSEDMKRYAIKHDGVRRYLASEEETTAAERGLLLVTGRRQVNFLPRRARTFDADDTS